ncbi:PPE family protein [Mycobacterium attenuatum]|uniref:PPE family protein n=1 Tax=Mycobacterium attenuatum TaxID=2341086 RepID=UPI000F0261E0|nr:PPE family protein [Mycobacterium attenuatum]VBA49041.1 putative PPE family protein PPE42 [Mycobacterium attenuatum]VBA54512.1 putative PPE family protein PPE42 [Mycobacterium attenuatum]
MTFPMLPPEINSLRMFIGAGTAPMLQAATAWAGLAEELGAAAQSFASVTSGLAGQAWQGPAAAAMAAAAAPYAAWLSAAAAQSAGAAGQASAMASMFEAAQAATVLPGAVAANRDSFVQLVMSNLFGQNAPAIAIAESIYEEMWAADVSAMSGYYSGAAALASQLVPWQSILKGLPGLGSAGAAGASAGSGVAGAGSVGGGSGDGANVGAGNLGNASGGAVVGDTNNVVNADPGGGLSQADPMSGNVGPGSAGSGHVGSASLLAGGATSVNGGAVGPGMMGVPVPIPTTGGNQSGSAGVSSGAGSTGNAVAQTRAPEAAAPPAPEVEAAAPHMGVLPNADPEIAAKAAPAPVARVAQSTGSGIPESALRPRATDASPRSSTKEDQQASEAEDKPVSLRPEAEPGKLRPRAKQDAGIQMRGG